MDYLWKIKELNSTKIHIPSLKFKSSKREQDLEHTPHGEEQLLEFVVCELSKYPETQRLQEFTMVRQSNHEILDLNNDLSNYWCPSVPRTN